MERKECEQIRYCIFKMCVAAVNDFFFLHKQYNNFTGSGTVSVKTQSDATNVAKLGGLWSICLAMHCLDYLTSLIQY